MFKSAFVRSVAICIPFLIQTGCSKNVDVLKVFPMLSAGAVATPTPFLPNSALASNGDFFIVDSYNGKIKSTSQVPIPSLRSSV